MNKKMIFVLLSSFVFSYCNAMEKLPLQKKENLHFTIENAFSDPVRVVYEVNLPEQGLKSDYLDLRSGEMGEIDEWRHIIKLVVGPYGEWKKLGTKAIFGLEPRDYTYDLRKQAANFPQYNMKMTIASGAPRAEMLSQVKPYLEKFLPYNVTILPTIAEKRRIEIPESGLIEDVLPRVKEAIEKGQEVLPRYVFNLAPDASFGKVKTGYESLLKEWQVMQQSENPKKAQFAKDLVEIIDGAYDTIRADNHFKELKDKHFKLKS